MSANDEEFVKAVTKWRNNEEKLEHKYKLMKQHRDILFEELADQAELLSVIEALVKSHRKFFGLDSAFDAELTKAESILKKYQ